MNCRGTYRKDGQATALERLERYEGAQRSADSHGEAVAAFADGGQEWYKRGKLHREGGPAVVRANGDEAWYAEGRLHREGGPAVTREDGTRAGDAQGELHRPRGPAIVYP